MKLDTEILKKIILAANQAPSGDNCQPWIFVWKNECLEIFRVKERATSFFDSGNYSLLISLGTVIESIRIASHHFSLDVEIKITYDPLNQELPFAVCKFSESSTLLLDDLYSWLFKRYVDRRIYKKREPNHQVLKEINVLTKPNDSVQLRFVKKRTLEFYFQIINCELQVWKDSRPHSGLFHWLRFKTYGDLRDLDGMPWRSLGIVWIQAVFLRLCRSFLIQRIANTLGFLLQLRLLVLLQLFRSTELICLTVKSDTPADVVSAGALAMQVWLRLQRAGFGVQPMSAVSLGAYMAQHLNNVESDKTMMNLSKGTASVRTAFDISENEWPIWMLRTGPSSEMPEDCRAKRLPIEQIFKS